MCVSMNEEGSDVDLFVFTVKIMAVAFLSTGTAESDRQTDRDKSCRLLLYDL